MKQTFLTRDVALYSVLKDSSFWRCGAVPREVLIDGILLKAGSTLIYMCKCPGDSAHDHVLSSDGVMCINIDSRLDLRYIKRLR